MLFKKMFSRQWLITTILVVAGTLVCARLGIWQLDRLAQRRVFNAQVESMHRQPTLDLNSELVVDISKMEWRAVTVSGEYDFENQIAIRNQYNGGDYGYHLITPLLFSGKAVLVDRGWIPADGNSLPEDWRQYDELGEVKIQGQIRLGGTESAIGGVAEAELNPNETRRAFWNKLILESVAPQIPYPVLPAYIQLDAVDNDQTPPIPYQPTLDLTEGPHVGYAVQWFIFAAILFGGYPFYLRKN